MALAVETSGRLVPKAQVLEQPLLLIPQVLRTACGQGSADGKPETTLPGGRWACRLRLAPRLSGS